MSGSPSEELAIVNSGPDARNSQWRAWILVVAMAFLFLAWGIFIFFMVGDKGNPGWNFGVVKDAPGESVYSTERE